MQDKMRRLDDRAKEHNAWMRDFVARSIEDAERLDKLADQLDPARTATGDELAAKFRRLAKQMRASAERMKNNPLRTFDR